MNPTAFVEDPCEFVNLNEILSGCGVPRLGMKRVGGKAETPKAETPKEAETHKEAEPFPNPLASVHMFFPVSTVPI